MNLVRGIGRLLLGGFFVVNGAKAVKDPADFVVSARPIAERFVPLAKKALPAEAAAFVPQDTVTLVRANGVASVLGGLGMATGLGRRSGAFLAALSMVPHVAAASPQGSATEDKSARRSLLLRNLALLGGALVVSQDTAGQPGLAWRASDARRRLVRTTDRAQRQIAKDADHFKQQATLRAKLARKNIEGALP